MTCASDKMPYSRGPLEKTTVRLPQSLYVAMTGIAARAGRSFSGECAVALTTYAQRGKAQTQRARYQARRRAVEPTKKPTIYLSAQLRLAIDPTRQHGVLRRELLAALEEHVVREQARCWRANRRLRASASTPLAAPAHLAPQRVHLPVPSTSSDLHEDTDPTQSLRADGLGDEPTPARRYPYQHASTAPVNAPPRT